MENTRPIDSVEFASRLIKRPSVTPADAEALDTLQRELEAMGFVCTRYAFGEGPQGPNARVDNLYARLGTKAPNFCFAGHTDVVPAGDTEKWNQDPFAGQVKDGELLGRGAADMKGAIAAFVGALSELLSSGWTPEGSISFLITGDEEGPALNGTKKLLVGSFNADITVTGKQGHVAYPHRGINPVPTLLGILGMLQSRHLDDGSEFFQPSLMSAIRQKI